MQIYAKRLRQTVQGKANWWKKVSDLNGFRVASIATGLVV